MQPHTAKITFEGTHYDGAEVKVRLDTPVAFSLEMMDLSSSNEHAKVMERFCEVVLISWNLENADGSPIAARFEEMQEQPFQFFNYIMEKWTTEVTDMPDPLRRKSPDGSMSAEDMMSMANSSQSLG